MIINFLIIIQETNEDFIDCSCYNEQEALPIFYRETKKVMESMDCDYEMIFVNDGSKDGTLELLKEFAKEDTHVTYIGFPEILERKRLCMPVFAM